MLLSIDYFSECCVGDYTAGGLKLDFFPTPVLEQEQRENTTENARIIARNMLRCLMMRYEGNAADMFSTELLSAVFVQRNPKLLCGMRHAFQEGFDQVWQQLDAQNASLSTEQNNQAELYISNCLSVLPFADLKPGHVFYIPQLIDGAWQRVRYRVEPIELTPTRGFETLFMRDDDRVFAYGLEPVGLPEAKSHLIFMGTTYPAGQGFFTQAMTDLEAETVGYSLYRTGRQKIIAWLNKQNQKVHACGMSLGGSLALLLAIDQGEQVSRVDALNPAGLYDAWSKSDRDGWENLGENDKPEVVIQKQGHDFVSSLGIWKKDWTILHVIPHEAALFSPLDHARNYAGYDDTIFEQVDVEQDNEARRARNIFIYSLLRGLAYYSLMLPVHYLIRPVFRYTYEHCLKLAMLGLVFACVTPLMPLNLALAMIAVPVVLHIASLLVKSADVWLGYADMPPAKIHEPVDGDIECMGVEDAEDAEVMITREENNL
jgi:pimeloyl-ACP methyl ester carboxylesterase